MFVHIIFLIYFFTSAFAHQDMTNTTGMVILWGRTCSALGKKGKTRAQAMIPLFKEKREAGAKCEHVKLSHSSFSLILNPHLINNIQFELSSETRIVPARLYPCPTILLGLIEKKTLMALGTPPVNGKSHEKWPLFIGTLPLTPFSNCPF